MFFIAKAGMDCKFGSLTMFFIIKSMEGDGRGPFLLEHDSIPQLSMGKIAEGLIS
ncbi:hypothetical protein [Paenibacillus eucommiae]|uniref:Uncharacterized protein n=1 Tax=Paenibacillus eucommiae TaxID=1355755 RepID=A0ABS4J0A5_9BACL|nr:hypothetical protein [Paenibacillus eucommiae]MBP1993246.1 hypothetical protein [Paenibacillus eucommiae]